MPFDAVDQEDLAAPHSWDMKQVLHFTLVMGPLASVFDLAIFGLLLWGYGATLEEFRTAWFVERMVTQTLMIFLIRTAGPTSRATRPHPVLVATSLGTLAAALALALGPIAVVLGFAPLLGLVVLYLAAAEALKRVAVPRAAR